jgi:hypothetical protein
MYEYTVHPSKQAEPKSITLISDIRLDLLTGGETTFSLVKLPSSAMLSLSLCKTSFHTVSWSLGLSIFFFPNETVLDNGIFSWECLGGEGTRRMFSGFKSQWIMFASSMVARAFTICLVNLCTTDNGNPLN